MSAMKASDDKGRIHEIGDNAHGEPTSAGHYVVGPDGRLVLQSHAMPLKEGWRAATHEEIEHQEQAEAARKRAEASPPSSSSPEPHVETAPPAPSDH